MHRITVVLHVPVDDDRLLIQLNNFHLLRLTNTENPDMEPFPVYCNRFVLLKVEKKFYKLVVIIQYMNLLNMIEIPFLSAIESKKHHGASEPEPHFTKHT